MMMHDEGTAIYDLLIGSIFDRRIELTVIAAAIIAALMVFAFVSDMLAALARQDREQELRDQEAILDLEHRGQWPVS